MSVSETINPTTALDMLADLLADVAESGTNEIGTSGRLAFSSSARVLIVDDEVVTAKIIRKQLRDSGYHNAEYISDAARAMHLLSREQFDVVLLDVQMPGYSGFELLGQLRSQTDLPWTPVVMLTADSDHETRIRALQLGATDFLNKPVNVHELVLRVRNMLLVKESYDRQRNYAADLEREVQRRTRQLELAQQQIVHALGRAAEFRDDDTGHHVYRVGRYARIIGEQMGFSERDVDLLEQAAQLHDVGKIGIPDEILLKQGKLLPEELEYMRRHSQFGKQIIEPLSPREVHKFRHHPHIGSEILKLGDSPLLELAAKVALTHHERWDGGGYPLGLAGTDIPLEGRITAVADVFDALSCKRPYKPAFPITKCFEILREESGKHFDPDVVEAFFAGKEEILNVHLQYIDEVPVKTV